MKEMKQNKNTSVVIRVAFVILAFVFIMCSHVIPSFADNSFEEQPLPELTQSTTIDNYNASLAVFTIDGGKVYKAYSVDDNNSDVYVFYESTNRRLYFASESVLSAVVIYPKKTSPQSNFDILASTVSANSNSLDATSQLYVTEYYGVLANLTPESISVPTYSSQSEGLLAVRNYIDNGSGTVAEFNYCIKPGYALFIDIHDLSDVSGTLFTNTSAAYASPHTSNQTLSYQSAMPSGNVSPQGNGISWQGTGNKDLFGRYKSWNCTLIVQPNKHYIAIYNPVHINTYVDPEHEDFNGNISVHVNKAFSQTSILIPLNTELTGTGTVGTNTTDSQKPVVYDENTNTWVAENEDGTPYTESPYGDYLPATTNSIHDWLQNIANLISGFFNGAIGAVTTLVGAGSAFINQLVSLYSWLPAPVYAVLSSALILVITIGVIKVFI